MTELELRDKIQTLEAAMQRCPPLPIELAHIFAEGLYARTMRVPAGGLVVGKRHTTGHLNVLLQGTIAVVTESGLQHLTAPAVIPSPAGVKKVGLAQTEVIWMTVHATPLTDLDELEATLTTMDPEALLCPS